MENIRKNKFCLCIILILTIMCCLLCGCSKQPNKREIVTQENSIGNLTIFAHANTNHNTLPLLFNLGHSYVTFENTSSTKIKIGSYTVEPNETICIGTWSISSHFGVWYNLEYNYSAIHNRYDGRVSVTKNVVSSDIEKINAYIYNNNTWNPLKNCSHFALNVWNEVALDSEKLDAPIIYSPAKVAKQIMRFENYETNKPMVTATNFGYFSNTEYVSFTMEGEYKYV